MYKKTIATLCVALAALTIVPTSSAADLGGPVINLRCDQDYVAVATTTSSSSGGCLGGISSGCTTVFVGAEGNTAGTYVDHLYNDPLVVSDLISWHLALVSGTRSNANAFVNCAV